MYAYWGGSIPLQGSLLVLNLVLGSVPVIRVLWVVRAVVDGKESKAAVEKTRLLTALRCTTAKTRAI